MFESLDRVGGGLVNIVLGALILWVGQTTFHHAGQLASVDQKFAAFEKQFTAVDKRYEGLRNWLEKGLGSVKERNRQSFTTDDAEKLIVQLRKLDDVVAKTERRLTDRLSDVEVKLAALQSRSQKSEEVASLQMEVAQLRAALAQSPAPVPAAYQGPTEVAQARPLYLPPVTIQR